MNQDGLVRRVAERAGSRTGTGFRFRDVRYVEVTASTNKDVMSAAERGGGEGLVVVADFQTAGRGRLDRRWEASPGQALLVSLLLRPAGLDPARWYLLAGAAALSAQFACAEVAGVATVIKWPNDLLDAGGGAKLAGILAEATAGRAGAGADRSAVAVGMGVNVHGGPPGAAVLDELAGRKVSRSDLVACWLADLDSRLGDWDRIASDYADACGTVGRRVEVDLGHQRRLLGVAVGVDSAGRLVVRGEDGGETVLSVGDVTHLR